jgi:hypothetical protein
LPIEEEEEEEEEGDEEGEEEGVGGKFVELVDDANGERVEEEEATAPPKWPPPAVVSAKGILLPIVVKMLLGVVALGTIVWPTKVHLWPFPWNGPRQWQR